MLSNKKNNHFHITLHNICNLNFFLAILTKVRYYPLCYLEFGHMEKLKTASLQFTAGSKMYLELEVRSLFE